VFAVRFAVRVALRAGRNESTLSIGRAEGTTGVSAGVYRVRLVRAGLSASARVVELQMQ